MLQACWKLLLPITKVKAYPSVGRKKLNQFDVINNGLLVRPFLLVRLFLLVRNQVLK